MRQGLGRPKDHLLLSEGLPGSWCAQAPMAGQGGYKPAQHCEVDTPSRKKKNNLKTSA